MEFRQFPSNAPDRPPKYVVVIFLFFSFFVLVLGFFQIRGQVYSAFDTTPSSEDEEDAILSLQDASERILAENSKDTDKDGLLDYDELYVYNTSPYLPDSDGDGSRDGEEIEKNTDPNCPPGKECERAEEENLKNGPSPESLKGLIPDIGDDTVFFPKAEQLRTMLKEAGVDEALFNTLSDSELEALFQQSYDSVMNPEEQMKNISETLDKENAGTDRDAESLKKILESLNTQLAP